MQCCADVLRYAKGAMEASAVDIVPRAGDAALERRLMDEALAEMQLAEMACTELAARGQTTRASVKEEAGSSFGELTLAKARAVAAVGAWEAKSDRWRAAVKAADVLCDKQTEEVGRLVLLFGTACPSAVLELLLPGARSVGLKAAADGSVVTPGEVLGAVRRVMQGLPTVTIPTALSRYSRIFAPLAGIVSSKAVAVWGTMLSQLKALQRDLSGQVGVLTAHIVGRWIHDMVREAVGTLGGSGPSLADLLEEELGDGKCCVDSLTFDALFVLLCADAVRLKVEWMSTLRGVGTAPPVPVPPAEGERLRALKAAMADVAPTGGKLVCFTFRNNGTCSYGDSCKFSHDVK